MFGVRQPDAGEVLLDGTPLRARSPADALRNGVAMVHQHFSLVEALTVTENLVLGALRWRRAGRADAARIRDLGARYGLPVDPNARVADLSIGERQRVEILKGLAHEPRVLVLDEPTAVLAPRDIERLLALCRRIAGEGHAVLLVTHKLAEVGEVCDAVSVLRAGRMIATVPRAEADPARLVALMVGRDEPGADPTLSAALGLGAARRRAPARSSQPARAGGAPVLALEGVASAPSDGRVALRDLQLALAPGEIVGIAGVEGNGQRELADVVAGAVPITAGRLLLAGRDVTRLSQRARADAGLAVIPEDRHHEGCVPALSIAENLAIGDLGRFTRFGLLRRRALRDHARARMAAWDVRAPGPDVPLRTLSGGNQQRVVLARELSRDPLLAVLATQPTRGLDVSAVVAVLARLRAVAAEGAAVLLISSELNELLSIADRVHVMYRGALVAEVDPGAAEALERVGALMSGERA